MPAKCHWCETNTHSDDDKERYPVCNRVFLTKNEAWTLIGDNGKESYYVICNPRENVLVGADWERQRLKDLIEKSEYIELAARTGVARKMKHGIAIFWDSTNWFVETEEKALKCFEVIYVLQ